MAYVDLRESLSIPANHYIYVGERSNGKSYSIKSIAIENNALNGEKIAYVRRKAEDASPMQAAKYWRNMGQILEQHYGDRIDGGTLFEVAAARGELTVTAICGQEVVKVAELGDYFSLDRVDRYKGTEYPNTNMMVWEEFLSKERELRDEFGAYLSMYSTLRRDKSDFKSVLIGNTVARSATVLDEMGIDLRKIPQGTRQEFNYRGHSVSGNEIRNRVIVEYFPTREKSNEIEGAYFFDSPRDRMIRTGAWDVAEYPTYTVLPHDITDACVILHRTYKLYVYISPHAVYCSNVRDPRYKGDYLLFCEATQAKRKMFSLLGVSNPAQSLRRILTKAYTEGIIFYSDDYSGDDTERVLKEVYRIC